VTRQRRSSNDLAERRARLRRGVSGEWIAVGLLVAKGYRILARRLRTPFGEIDIIAVRGKRIAFVEVKRRGTIEDAEAALTPAQGRRIGDAAEWWIGRYPRYRDHEMGLDAVLVVPRTWPRHIPNALG
jgi:putative endonuclease